MDYTANKAIEYINRKKLSMIKHVAFVMDGNRRWAKRRGLMPWHGHQEGVQALKRVVDFCLTQRIPYASFYTFSLENFKRSEEEKNFLFNLIIDQAEASLPLFFEKNARIRFVGDRESFPVQVRAACERIEQRTSHLTGIILNFLFCYGGRQELISSVKAIAQALQEGSISHHDINHDLIEKYLWTTTLPEPELIIRTGGVRRLSNFFLYQAAYSEIFFLDCLWPEISEVDLNEIVQEYAKTQRNFGS